MSDEIDSAEQALILGPLPFTLWADLALFVYPAEADRVAFWMVALLHTQPEHLVFVLESIVSALEDVAANIRATDPADECEDLPRIHELQGRLRAVIGDHVRLTKGGDA